MLIKWNSDDCANGRNCYNGQIMAITVAQQPSGADHGQDNCHIRNEQGDRNTHSVDDDNFFYQNGNGNENSATDDTGCFQCNGIKMITVMVMATMMATTIMVMTIRAKIIDDDAADDHDNNDVKRTDGNDK